jgi:hypothetical protein
VAGSRESGDKPSGCGATDLVSCNMICSCWFPVCVLLKERIVSID